MVFDISQLKKIRKQLELTQNQFAKEAGISQSMIAKIESGRLDPTYSKIKQIEKAVKQLAKQEEKTAQDIMHKEIISANPNKKASEIIEIMNKRSISQIPVIKGEKVIGLITESSILKKKLSEINNLTVKDIMAEAPPIIDKNAGINIIKQLLQFYPIILIKEKGNLIGLITKADLIKNLV